MDAVFVLLDQGKRSEAIEQLLHTVRLAQARCFAAMQDMAEQQGVVMAQAGKDAVADVSSVKIAVLVTLGVALAVAAVLTVWTTRSVTAPIRRAIEVSQAVAAGDLSVHFDASGKNETGQLLGALKEMQAGLVGVVARVRENSEAVASASAQIAQGNNDLSQRTEEQASALEQTAAAMEQLGSTVRQNADNARQANQLALSASTVAISGGEVVGRVVSTMRDINQSSQKIADIIGVIDGIAFQPNILALNAAVEAARAGEQGRGFAVVAGEVRSLASRSADAAKEIKVLIDASVERVEQGTALVDRAGSTMTEVVSSIRRVTDIMSEISAASTEQSTGVAQVGKAVVQMDRATQQNAALVEESAAAAESLKAQARQLVDVAAVFKLDARVPHAAARPAATATPIAPRPLRVAAASRSTSMSKRASGTAPAAVTEEWASF